MSEWWDKAEPQPNYDPKGYRYAPFYPYPNSECPDKSSLTGDLAKCEFKCLKDYDCPQLHYCCPNGCGRVCVPPKVTSTDQCGCSITFLTNSGNYYDYYESSYDYYDSYYYNYNYDAYYYDDEAQQKESILYSFIWESLNDSFTPSVEPYVIDADILDGSLGHFDTLCNLKKAINGKLEDDYFYHDYWTFNSYNVYKKAIRKLFIVTKRNETLKKIIPAALKETYKTICLITIGSAKADDELVSQLTLNSSGKPCMWSVNSYHDLHSLTPNIKEIVNDGSCICPGEFAPVGPCTSEGGKCTKDIECDEPNLICDKGVCRNRKSFETATFNPKHDNDYDFFSSFYDNPDDDRYFEEATGYHHTYDYFTYVYDLQNDEKPKIEVYDDYDFMTSPFNAKTPLNYVKSPNQVKSAASQKSHIDYDTDQFDTTYKGHCDRNYFLCSGVPSLCIIDHRVCDGTPDCPYKDDESPEACAKRTCGEGWFKCASGECVAKELRCNGVENCPDGSDEYCKGHSDCPPYRQHYCSSGECISHYEICDGSLHCKNGEDELGCKCKGFRCNSGECVGSYEICDGTVDCSDGSDENCINRTCTDNRKFRCEDGECIYKSNVCDRYYDCRDKSDESIELCQREKCFNCTSGKCILNSTVCDGFDDCEDGSDESNCKNFKCLEGKFHCGSGECLSESVLCNGREECADGSDESSCDTIGCFDSKPLKCSSGECISHTQVCDGVFDCADKSDESKCPNLPCPADRKEKCLSGECLYYVVNCDNNPYCVDGSDELNCDVPKNAFQCKTGEWLQNARCNGYRECPDGSDEEDCEGVPCDYKKDFRCNSGECVSQYNRCDGEDDCRDGTDENCEGYSCKKDFKCKSGVCISKYDVCDGDLDCKDGGDESDCNPSPKCYFKEINCKSGECQAKYKFCDGYAQCYKGTDEQDCSSFKCPYYRPFKCGSGECRRAFHRCDGFVNCADGSDEEDCGNFTCPPARPFTCSSGICITYYQVCNGYDDCGDGSDEKDCDSFICPDKTYQCKARNCIPKRFICDKEEDCSDGDDEVECVKKCKNKYLCDVDNKCIPSKKKCDGIKDCSDGADEKNCNLNP